MNKRLDIINKKINKLISSFVKSKNYKNIIYINPYLNNYNFELIINNFKNKFKCISEFIILDNYNIPKCKNFYPLVDEVIFFPSYKRIKLIECVPYKN